VLYLVTAALQSRPPHLRRAALVAESFGGCLGLRAALAAPGLFSCLVLINPATSFASSLGGLSSLVCSTNLLALFPRELFGTAQRVMMPLLVRGARRPGGVGVAGVLFVCVCVLCACVCCVCVCK
jgi:pimeloyl-ACP methyl ester carboxylesterase